jgi:hypothetical protein
VPTLILTPRYTEDAQALWGAAGQLGWNVERLTSWRAPEHLRNVPEPVLYIEALFGPTLAEHFGLKLVDPPEDWLMRAPEQYRKRSVCLSTLGEARSLRAAQFIKPPNDKSFPAQIYLGSELPAEYPDETPVLVSDVVEWEKEFRCFVLDRELRTYSVYCRGGELQGENDFAQSQDEEEALEEFMGQLLDDPRVDLPKATVIDVGVIAGRGWAVVELNGAWGAGIYGCDPVQVLRVIRHASTPAD